MDEFDTYDKATLMTQGEDNAENGWAYQNGNVPSIWSTDEHSGSPKPSIPNPQSPRPSTTSTSALLDSGDRDASRGERAESVRILRFNSILGETTEESRDSRDDHLLAVSFDAVSMLQAVVFIEDAFHYRSIYHKVSSEELHLYRVYKSRLVNCIRMAVITLLHLLAFVEYPSSLSWTSDLRYETEPFSFPCWSTQTVEALCLLFLLLDDIIRMRLMGFHYYSKNMWEVFSILILIFSFADWSVSSGLHCMEFIRPRRLLRPYFIIQNSSLMKKIVRCLRMTVPEIASVLLLLFGHIFIFTLLGMLLFPVVPSSSNSTSSDTLDDTEGNQYMPTLLDAFINLLVLLTTANNPDVTLPAYNVNRLASIFFILYLMIGLYFFMNVLLAVIYNQFRGYFTSSMQSSLLRRRLAVRAAFEVLQAKVPDSLNSDIEMEVGLGPGLIRSVVEMCELPEYVKTSLLEHLNDPSCGLLNASKFQELFSAMDKDVIHKQKPSVRWFDHPNLRRLQKIVLHKYFTALGVVVALFNLLAISIELGLNADTASFDDENSLRLINFFCVVYYMCEQALKFWANGWRRFLMDRGMVYESVVTLALVAGEIASLAMDYSPFSSRTPTGNMNNTLWIICRVNNILIMVRMLKIIPLIKSMNLVASVLLDMIRNMQSFLGISVVCFYSFAILGMQIFHGAIKYDSSMANETFACGTYQQLDYWANNFDDFFAALVVLWDIMVVNNWIVFLTEFRAATSAWSYLYFIVWWVLSVIIVLNLFTALVMENLILKWDRQDQLSGNTYELENATIPVHLNTVHSMFRDVLKEPNGEELVAELRKHHYLKVRGSQLDEEATISTVSR